MAVLEISQLDQEPDYSGFTCGVKRIDNMVKESFFPHILRQAKTFKIAVKGTEVVAGYYQISICAIKTDNSNVEYGDYGDYGESEPQYGAVKLEFLAIDKRLQHKGIGTEVLRKAVQDAVELGKEWPVRVLIIEALVGKTEWYGERGFKIFSNHQEEEYGTIKMFFDLMGAEEKKRVAEYCEAMS